MENRKRLQKAGDRTAAEFEADFGGADTFDFKITLKDKGTVFVVLGPILKRGQIFLAWHFDSEGQFIDYVERLCPPQGVSDYEWMGEVCAEVGGYES